MRIKIVTCLSNSLFYISVVCTFLIDLQNLWHSIPVYNALQREGNMQSFILYDQSRSTIDSTLFALEMIVNITLILVLSTRTHLEFAFYLLAPSCPCCIVKKMEHKLIKK